MCEKRQKNAEKKQEQEKEEEDFSYFYDNDKFVGDVLDELGLTRICCRRHFLTHVDLIDII